jgi:hypothetical protein
MIHELQNGIEGKFFRRLARFRHGNAGTQADDEHGDQ